MFKGACDAVLQSLLTVGKHGTFGVRSADLEEQLTDKAESLVTQVVTQGQSNQTPRQITELIEAIGDRLPPGSQLTCRLLHRCVELRAARA